MSGAEVVGLISGIIAMISASLQLYDAVDDAAGLPQSFRDVAARLPLVQDTLDAARAGVVEQEADGGRRQEAPSTASRLALARVLTSCHDKAAALNEVLEAVMPAAGASRTRRYLKALKTIPNADKVENLMGGILGDLQVLTGSRALGAARGAHMGRLAGPGAWPDGPVAGPTAGPAAVALHNLGPGSQFVHTGQGHQNMASGGVQVNGATGGPLYFGHGPAR